MRIESMTATIEKKSWSEVKDAVYIFNPELVELVDEACPSGNFDVYHAKYPYGEMILENGRFIVPAEVSSNDRNSLETNKTCAHEFDVNEGVPVGILLKQSLELFFNLNGKIMPWAIFKPGSIFGLWKHLESSPSYHPIQLLSISSGARNLFMLPNIADLSQHRHLKRDFNLRLPPASNLVDQWSVFRQLARSPAADSSWQSEVIFFPTKWLATVMSDTAWRPVAQYFLEYGWKNTAYWRNHILYEYYLSALQDEKNMRSNPYLTDTASHLLSISSGASPAFEFATDDSVAPVSLLQNIYVSSYSLKKYHPTMLQPAYFASDLSNKSVYYSLQQPTTIRFSPKSRQIQNVLFEISELKHIMDVFTKQNSESIFSLSNTPLCNIGLKTHFKYYHSKVDRHGEIEPSSNILLPSDLDLNQFGSKNSQFASNGAFLRGCVEISSYKAPLEPDEE